MITEQDGQIIIDSLRPMSEEPKRPEGIMSVTVLVFYKNQEPSTEEFWLEIGWYKKKTRKALGWIYTPIYKPKKADE